MFIYVIYFMLTFCIILLLLFDWETPAAKLCRSSKPHPRLPLLNSRSYYQTVKVTTQIWVQTGYSEYESENSVARIKSHNARGNLGEECV